MTLKPLGDSAWLVEFPGRTGEAALVRVSGLVAALEKNLHPGVADIVPSFASVAVHYHPGEGPEVREWIGAVTFEDVTLEGTEHLIPVSYGGTDGPDLEEIAEATGLTPTKVIELHEQATYRVATIGFAPGFPYLSGLPDALFIPRKMTPRRSVPGGSVAIAAGQAGIYPMESPAGWHILGRTDLNLFDPKAERPALLKTGDTVRFTSTHQISQKAPDLTKNVESAGWIEVIQPGAMTTVQDLGRPGLESSGVSPGGAADPQSLRAANLLVGNPEDAAALEICMTGPVLRFHKETTIAYVSATGRPRRVLAGEAVNFSTTPGGVRAYLAIAGGITVPSVMGSRSTDVRGKFGGFHGRALQAGDWLETDTQGSTITPGNWHHGLSETRRGIELRYVAGVQQRWFSDAAKRIFRSSIYQISPVSDRMGTRLSGPVLELAAPREMVSQPVVSGSIQVPPDGQPIILMAERQTIGGYPQIGHVITADMPKLARAWPGTPVRFREIPLEEAWALRNEWERSFVWLRTGLELLK